MLTHEDLTTLTPDQQRREVCDDRANLLSRGFSPVLSFAYHYGSYNESAKAVAAECGYSSARIAPTADQGAVGGGCVDRG